MQRAERIARSSCIEEDETIEENFLLFVCSVVCRGWMKTNLLRITVIRLKSRAELILCHWRAVEVKTASWLNHNFENYKSKKSSVVCSAIWSGKAEIGWAKIRKENNILIN